ncbi:MAG: ATP-binding protein [Ignavibacteria bacterium]|jgi:predicted AAA+ superfamily ATPase
MNIKREIEKQIKNKLLPGKVLLLFGTRRVGKTFLMNQIIKSLKGESLVLNGEDLEVQEILNRRTIQNYKNLIGNKKYLFIDEAQHIPEIGKKLKLMIDELKNLRILVTGSSSFDLSNLSGEPLTGRKMTFMLYPFSEREISKNENLIGRKDNLMQRLVFGNYPEVYKLKNENDKIDYLKELVNSYLLKDILQFEGIKNSSVIFNLLKLISYQVGSFVSYEELGKQLNISKNTVNRYLDLLSKSFIIYKLNGFSRNLRKEITKSPKWYFYDNGIRNAIIANFSRFELRDDIGKIWENYLVGERIKFQNYSRMVVNNYFWRTYDKQEIDWIEERDGKLFAFEFKWKEQKRKIPAAWIKNYPDSNYELISNDNYMDFLS